MSRGIRNAFSEYYGSLFRDAESQGAGEEVLTRLRHEGDLVSQALGDFTLGEDGRYHLQVDSSRLDAEIGRENLNWAFSRFLDVVESRVVVGVGFAADSPAGSRVVPEYASESTGRANAGTMRGQYVVMLPQWHFDTGLGRNDQPVDPNEMSVRIGQNIIHGIDLHVYMRLHEAPGGVRGRDHGSNPRSPGADTVTAIDHADDVLRNRIPVSGEGPIVTPPIRWDWVPGP